MKKDFGNVKGVNKLFEMSQIAKGYRSYFEIALHVRNSMLAITLNKSIQNKFTNCNDVFC